MVDDHELFSTLLVTALRLHGMHADQVGPVSRDTILAAANDRPMGLVVLDLNLGRDTSGQWFNGLDLVKALRGLGWQVLVVSGSSDQRWIAAAIAAGAIGSVPKSASFDALLSTVLSAATRQTVMSEGERRTWLELHSRHESQGRALALRLATLSNREREVLAMLAAGHRAAMIAEEFTVSLATVRSQIQSILLKLGVNSQLEAVALSRERPQWWSPQLEH